MKSTSYRVNEIFYSIQAEGANAGRAAVFVRFSGCNLHCAFCDTDHAPFTVMTGPEIDEEVRRLDPSGKAMVVFTGGEPTLQLLEEEPLCGGRFRAMETNGIEPPPTWIEWVTVSPKTRIATDGLSRANEIKVLHGLFAEDVLVEMERGLSGGPLLFIQSIAEPDGSFAVDGAIDFVKRHPAWRLSIQWHKLTGVR